MPDVIDQLDQVLEQVVGEGESSAEQADYGEGNKELPEALIVAIKGIVKYVMGLDRVARRQEVIDARRQRFYDEGYQYIYWDPQKFVFSTFAGGSVSTGSASVDTPKYTDVYNIYSPFGEIIASPLVQNPPGVNFEADDPLNVRDIGQAKAADKFRHVVDRANDRKALQSDISRLFWTDGRVVLHTRHEKGKEKITAYGVLEAKVPIFARSFAELPYIAISHEIDINMAKADNKDAADKIKETSSSTGESAFERNARLAVLQSGKSSLLAGDAYAHLVTEQMVWLRPAMFDRADEVSKPELRRLFPSGLYVKFIGDAYCCSYDETMDDALAVGHARSGDGQSRSSLGKNVVPIQDAFNDYKNLEKEMFDYGVPQKYFDSQVIDIEARREQVSQPDGAIPVTNPQPGTPLANFFHEDQKTEVPTTMIAAYQDLRGNLAEFICGGLPSLQGQSDPDNKTFRGQQLMRDQALGRSARPWASMQELFAKAYEQAVKIAANNRSEDEVINVAIPGRKLENDSVAIADLKQGKFHCKPSTDTSFPETYEAKRDRFMGLIEMAPDNPAVGSVLMQPDNLALFKEFAGFDDLVIPGAEARDKQLEEIDKLLKEAPVPASPQEMEAAGEQYGIAAGQAKAAGGMPPGPPPTPESLMQPSVKVDPVYDYHQFEFEECQRWLNSPECREQLKLGNLPGVQNVRLHGLEHKKIMDAMMAQQQAAQAQAENPPKKDAKPSAGGQDAGAA